MKLQDIGLALVIVFIWGTNFTVMKFGLEEIPPFLFVSLRFFFVVFPAIFFIRKPNTTWLKIFAVGLFMSMLQFGLLFEAMREDISAGLASMLLQSQVPFTIILSFFLLGESLRINQIIGVIIMIIGFVIFAGSAGDNLTFYGLALALLSGLSWAFGNLTIRRMPGVDPLGIVVFAGLVPILPLALASYIFEDQDPIGIISAMTFKGWGSLLFVAILSSLLGYSLWTSLLIRYKAAIVTPFALLIPVVGMFTGIIFLREWITVSEGIGFLTVFTGLLVCILGGRFLRYLKG